MTLTDNELDMTVLEDMEFAPACEKHKMPHEESMCTKTAEWIVWSEPLAECTCRHSPIRFFCDPCLKWRTRPNIARLLRCQGCGATGLSSRYPIYHVEPIDKQSSD